MSPSGPPPRHVADLAFLSEVTRETLSSLNLDAILRRVVQLLRNRFGYDYAAVALVEGNDVVFRAGSWGALDVAQDRERVQDGGHSWRLPLGQGLVGSAATGYPRLVNNVQDAPDYVEANSLMGTRAELAVPVLHHDKVLGVLDVQSRKPNAFDEDDRLLLEMVAALVAPAVHTARLYESQMRRTGHLQLVGEISKLVMFSSDSAGVVAVASRAIRQVLGLTYVGVGLVDRQRRRVVHVGCEAPVPLDPTASTETPMGEGIFGVVAASGRSLMLDDLTQTPHITPPAPTVRSVLCVPLRVREAIIGALSVGHDSAYHFADEELNLLGSLAAYIAQAIENAKLFEDQRRRWQQMLVINEVTRIATETFDLDRILDLVVREVHHRFGYFAAAVYLVDEPDVVLHAVQCDERVDRAVGYREPLSVGLAGQVAQTGEVLDLDACTTPGLCGLLRADVNSVLSVPLQAQHQVIGVLQVQNLEEHSLGDHDRLVLETLAKSVAGAIANARAIQQAEQLRDDLTRMVVHDLRNPIQAMLLTLQEVERVAQDTLTPTVNQAVSEGTLQANSILGMVNSLLDVARFEAGKTQLKRAPSVLNDHIRDVFKRNTAQARSRGIQIELELSDKVPVLWIDAELVSRTVDNLVSNALKFTPAGGSVTLCSEPVEDQHPQCPTRSPCVLVSVADSGEGIPARFHRKIFEKFGQVETRKAGLKMSTGLGLALCRYVAEAHGGDIWVESQVGTGSIFRFTLPTGRPQ